MEIAQEDLMPTPRKPKTLEDALAEIKQLRKENKTLRTTEKQRLARDKFIREALDKVGDFIDRTILRLRT